MAVRRGTVERSNYMWERWSTLSALPTSSSSLAYFWGDAKDSESSSYLRPALLAVTWRYSPLLAVTCIYLHAERTWMADPKWKCSIVSSRACAWQERASEKLKGSGQPEWVLNLNSNSAALAVRCRRCGVGSETLSCWTNYRNAGEICGAAGRLWSAVWSDPEFSFLD